MLNKIHSIIFMEENGENIVIFQDTNGFNRPLFFLNDNHSLKEMNSLFDRLVGYGNNVKIVTYIREKQDN